MYVTIFFPELAWFEMKLDMPPAALISASAGAASPSACSGVEKEIAEA